MITIGDAVKEIQNNISWFVPNEKIVKNQNQLLTETRVGSVSPETIVKICEVYNHFVSYQQMNISEANVNINRILTEEGMVYEAVGYYWLMQTALLPWITPLYSTAATLSGNLVELDGCYDESIAFDIKKYQDYPEMLGRKLRKLEKTYPDYVFLQAGHTDVSKEQFFDKNVIEEIEKAQRAGVQRAQIELPNNGRIKMERRKGINISESSEDPFLWCRNNYKMFLSDCHQFTKDKPFLLIEVGDMERHNMLPVGAYMRLRTLVRRTFFELSKSEEDVSAYDKKMSVGYTVKDTIKYLSSIMFIDKNSGKAYAFINPFAVNKMERVFFEHYGWDYPTIVDDFSCDNY